jgi:hypothetical protein
LHDAATRWEIESLFAEAILGVHESERRTEDRDRLA